MVQRLNGSAANLRHKQRMLGGAKISGCQRMIGSWVGLVVRALA